MLLFNQSCFPIIIFVKETNYEKDSDIGFGT